MYIQFFSILFLYHKTQIEKMHAVYDFLLKNLLVLRERLWRFMLFSRPISHDLCQFFTILCGRPLWSVPYDV